MLEKHQEEEIDKHKIRSKGRENKGLRESGNFARGTKEWYFELFFKASSFDERNRKALPYGKQKPRRKLNFPLWFPQEYQRKHLNRNLKIIENFGKLWQRRVTQRSFIT